MWPTRRRVQLPQSARGLPYDLPPKCSFPFPSEPAPCSPSGLQDQPGRSPQGPIEDNGHTTASGPCQALLAGRWREQHSEASKASPKMHVHVQTAPTHPPKAAWRPWVCLPGARLLSSSWQPGTGRAPPLPPTRAHGEDARRAPTYCSCSW